MSYIDWGAHSSALRNDQRNEHIWQSY
jgi:hypothetical protein